MAEVPTDMVVIHNWDGLTQQPGIDRILLQNIFYPQSCANYHKIGYFLFITMT